jgi:membrane fusion protein (multidrug efflux system)
VYNIKPENVTFYDSYPGTVTALKEVGLRGEVTGYITGISFKEGSHVAKGQQLYEIDRRQYQAAFEEAKDNLKIAQDNLARIQRDVGRYTALNNQDAIALQQYDHAMTDLGNARSQVSVVSQELVKAKTNLEYSLITAPFDGSIGISQVKTGDLITPGQTLLNTISSDDPMGVDFVIDQSELRRFQQIVDKKLRADDSTFRLALPDNTMYPASGKIDLIDRAVDPQTGTITVRLTFPNPRRDLRPGMNCNIRVMNTPEGPQMLIPFKAVQEQMGEYFVFLYDKNVAKEVKVKLGPRVGPGVIIQEGLEQGEAIIVDGIGKIGNGVPVTTGSRSEQANNSWKK